MTTIDNPHYVTVEQAAEMDCVMKPDEYWCKGPKCMRGGGKKLLIGKRDRIFL